MKPQQQNTDVKGNSHVYVQTPEGEEKNIPAKAPAKQSAESDENFSQTAENTPTTHSEEVTSGEDA